MKKLSIFLILAITVVAVAVAAHRGITPSDKTVKRTFTMQSFDKIDISKAIEVVYEQTSGNSYSVTISAPENIIDHVISKQSRRTLKLSLGNISVYGSPLVKITVKSPVLKEVKMSGATEFKAKSVNFPGQEFEIEASGASSIGIGKITAKKIGIDLSGASKATISKIDSDEVDADASGASHITLSGKTNSVDLDSSGASSINAKKLKAINGKLEASGASSISSSVKNTFHESVSGASRISNN